MAPMALRPYGPVAPMVLWHYGPMVLWPHGPMAVWSCLFFLLRSHDSLVIVRTLTVCDLRGVCHRRPEQWFSFHSMPTAAR